jgi:hypothetical protein
MKTQDLYEVWAVVTRPRFDLSLRAFFDRMPTVHEFIEVIASEFIDNEAYRPGVSEAVVELLARGGLPIPPPDLATDVGAILSYPDGWLKVTRTRRFLLDPALGPATGEDVSS